MIKGSSWDYTTAIFGNISSIKVLGITQNVGRAWILNWHSEIVWGRSADNYRFLIFLIKLSKGY